jgi:SAM-dependent methyltransferase
MTYVQRDHFDKKQHRYAAAQLKDPPVHVQNETRTLLELLKSYNAKRVIDFGSGNGRLTIPLLQNGYAVTAVDISTQSLTELHELAKRMGCDSHLKTTTNLPTGEAMDAVVGTDILHHLNLAVSLPQIRSAVKDTGVAIFSEPNILNGAWIVFITLFLDWKVEWRIIFCHYFSLKHELKRAGFRRVVIRGLGLFPLPIFARVPFLNNLNCILGNLPFLKLFAYRLIVEAS